MLQWAAAAAEGLNLSNPPSVFFPVAGFQDSAEVQRRS